MIYIKALFIAAGVGLAIIFMVQNIEELAEPLRIRLNLFFVQFESTPFATYLVILLAFFVGLFTASLLGLAERFRLRKLMRHSKKEVETLSKELNSLRNLPITSQPMASEAVNGEAGIFESASPGEPTGQTPAGDAGNSDKTERADNTEESNTQITPEEKEALT